MAARGQGQGQWTQ
jgi:hypothetical protein